MTNRDTSICILGGGFGGLYTALSLARLPWPANQQPEIVLVDQRDRFVFSPLLYELVTGELQTWEVAPPFEELLINTAVRFHQDTVEQIDLQQQCVHLTSGLQLSYRYLVLALGGETPLDRVPGAADHALPFRTIEDAYRLEERLRLLESSDASKIRIAIVGGGYSGVELACKLADRLGSRGRLRVIERAPEILQTSPEFNREAARQALADRGVWIDLETTVGEMTADTITLNYRDQVDTLPVELVLWTVGTRVAPAIRSLALPQNEYQQIQVEKTLQVVGHPALLALGDLADCRDATGQKVPATAQVALQQADYVAWNIWALMTDRPLLPFRYQHFGEMMTLGIDNATLTGLGIKLDGVLAHTARRLAYLFRLPTVDHQIKVGLNWIGQPLRDLLSAR